MRFWLVVWLAVASGCPPPAPVPTYVQQPYPEDPGPPARQGLGKLDDRMVDFAFDGGYLEFELYRQGSRVVQVARNRYAAPVMIRWSMTALDNLEPLSSTEGVALLPAASQPLASGPTVVLAELEQSDLSQRYRRELYFRARFGDPQTVPVDYAYRLPYPTGKTFSVLQGFHGAFSHRGSNEYAVDFDCPVATPVLATRPGMVVAANAAAQGSGTTAEFLDYKRTNFVLILHDDGSLGEYMHLAPSGVEVAAGQRIERGQPLGLSGNTGFSSTPHLHFQVMTAAMDGASARSFPFRFAVGPSRAEEPVQGRRYSAWE